MSDFELLFQNMQSKALDQRRIPGEDEKRCCTCKRIKHITKFGHNAAHKDGLMPHCKLCHDSWRKKKEGRH